MELRSLDGRRTLRILEMTIRADDEMLKTMAHISRLPISSIHRFAGNAICCAEITIVIISPILFTSYAAFAAALAAFSFAAFLSAIDCLTAVNTATQIPKTKNAPIG